MTPDRALDAEVAEKVMGLEIWRDSGAIFAGPPSSHPDTWTVPEYRADIAAAWSVVDRLFELGWQTEIWCEAPNTLGIPKWHVMLKRFGKPPKWKSVGDTAPEAICKAALMAATPEDPPLQRLPIGKPGQFLKVP